MLNSSSGTTISHPSAYWDDSDISEAVREELADALIYSLSMAVTFDIDLKAAITQKMDQNADRFDSESAAEFRRELEMWTDANNY